jgi:hypothetical protein
VSKLVCTSVAQRKSKRAYRVGLGFDSRLSFSYLFGQSALNACDVIYKMMTPRVAHHVNLTTGEWTAHDSILNHRKRVGIEPELLVKFDNRVQVWTLVDNAFVDSKEEEFHCLNDTAMVTPTLERVRHEDD